MSFIGRQKELKQMRWFLKKKTASLFVLMGRRRIGKTRLVEEFAKDAVFFRFSGLPPSKGVTHKVQKEHFLNDFKRYFNISVDSDDWSDIFEALSKLLPPKRTVLFFDEVSWLAGADRSFLPKLKDAWDRYFNKNPHLVFVLCGSVSSWIDRYILADTGFVGRISMTLRLGELSLPESRLFWNDPRGHISNYEILKTLCVVGGVPQYLEHIDKHMSAEENIERLCFTPGGLLVDEFDKIFHDVFSSRTTVYRNVLEQLVAGPKSIKELANNIGYEASGRLSEYIEHMEVSGFIKKDYNWNFKNQKTSSICRLRISDNYVRFFLKYIQGAKEQIQRDAYRFKQFSDLINWPSIMGLQFENLVLNNRAKIHEILGIEASHIVNENPYFQRPTKIKKGCQIDYLIQTRFNGLYLCEIKFGKNPAGVSVIQEVQDKIGALKLPSGFSIRPVLIHANGVSDDLQGSQYFSHIVGIHDLFQ